MVYDSLVSGFTPVASVFTPEKALMGGMVLGMATAAKYALTGRILGCSGLIKGVAKLKPDLSAWRGLFSVGFLSAAGFAAYMTPQAFEVLPASFTVARAALGGLLVGIGASLGNGCTSGHGITGNARLSVRSFVYTCTFMAAAMVTAALAKTSEALNLATVPTTYQTATAEVWNQGALLLATAAVTFMAIARLAEGSDKLKKKMGALAEITTGSYFAWGLVYTGMIQPSKVIAFLSVLQPGWDFSLALVMGGALLVALPVFQAITRFQKLRQPICGGSFPPPPPPVIDFKLLSGGLLFGAGWGLSGICPGPALVNLVQPSPQILAYVGTMALGMLAANVIAPETCGVPPAKSGGAKAQ